jgi:hypothetical protein
MTAPYFLARWTGMAFEPLPRDRSACLQAYETGRCYRMTEHQDRSRQSHDHYFAALAEAHGNLPEHVTARLPTPEHLRKFALIRTGFADNRTLVASSKAEAMRLAAFLRPMDEFAIVTVEGATVSVWTAQSQSMRAMGRARFQDSKTKVLDCVASMIGTDPGTLSREAGKAA